MLIGVNFCMNHFAACYSEGEMFDVHLLETFGVRQTVCCDNLMVPSSFDTRWQFISGTTVTTVFY